MLIHLYDVRLVFCFYALYSINDKLFMFLKAGRISVICRKSMPFLLKRMVHRVDILIGCTAV